MHERRVRSGSGLLPPHGGKGQTLTQRIAEASALRRFFQEQWNHIQSLLEGRQQTEERTETLALAVETIVDGTDKRLRSLFGYQKRLREGARALLDYVESLVQRLPPPLLVSRRNLVMDPMVRKLIRTPQQLHSLFGTNSEIRQFFLDPGNNGRDEVFALMFFIYQQQQRFGAEMRGEIIMHDVQQTLVSFVAPEVVAPRASEPEIRSATKEMLFESAIGHIRLELVKQRAQAMEEPGFRWLEPDRNIQNPEVYFNELLKLLARPGELLDIHEDQLHINSMGVKLPSEDNEVTTLQLQQLAVGEEPTRVMSMVRFPRSECDF